MRFGPLQRLKNPGAHFTRVYLARYVPPSGLLPSRRFASPENRRPCFMPATLLGFSLQSFSLGKEQANLARFRLCPPAVTGFELPRKRRKRSLRNRMEPDSTSGPWSPSEVRHPYGGSYPPTTGRCSPGLFSSPGFSPFPRWFPASQEPPFPKRLSVRLPRSEHPPYSIQVSLDGKVGLAPQSLPTLMRFSPSNVLTDSGLRRGLELLPGSPGCVSASLRCSPWAALQIGRAHV